MQELNNPQNIGATEQEIWERFGADVAISNQSGTFSLKKNGSSATIVGHTPEKVDSKLVEMQDSELSNEPSEILDNEQELESALTPEPLVKVKTGQVQEQESDNYEILMPKTFWETVKVELPNFNLSENINPTDFVNHLVTNRDKIKVIEQHEHVTTSEPFVFVNKKSAERLKKIEFLAVLFMWVGIISTGFFLGKRIRALWLIHKNK